MGNFCQQVLKPLGSYTHIADTLIIKCLFLILRSLTCTETDTLGICHIVFDKYINMEELQLKFSCSVCNTEN